VDPDETLKEIRRLSAIVRDRCDRGEDPDVDGSAAELAEAVQNLDEWLSKGGFLPAAWREEA
jgi:hypothetical protein